MSEEKSKRVVWILGSGFSKPLGGPLLDELLSEGMYRKLKMHTDDKRSAEVGKVKEEDQKRIRREEEIKDVQNTLGEEGIISPPFALDYRPQASKESQEVNSPYFQFETAFRDATEFFLQKEIGQSASTVERAWADAEEFLEEIDEYLSQDKSLQQAWFNQHHSFSSHSERTNLKNSLTTLKDGSPLKRLKRSIQLTIMETCSHPYTRDPKSVTYEKWDPYRRWMKEVLKPNGVDSIVTFNYDRVVEKIGGHLGIPIDVIKTKNDFNNSAGIPLFKMHGSFNWQLTGANSDQIIDIEEQDDARFSDFWIQNPKLTMAIGTPGKTKKALSETAFKAIWDSACAEIQKADSLVFIGYRLPPSDSYPREKLIEAIRRNAQNRDPQKPLTIHLVLGDDVNHPHVLSMREMLEVAVEGTSAQIIARGLCAQKFLGLIAREQLFEIAKKEL